MAKSAKQKLIAGDKSFRAKFARLEKAAAKLAESSAKRIELRNDYFEQLRELAKRARLLGWRVTLCRCNGGKDCHCDSDISDSPEDFLLAFGRKGDKPQDAGVFVPDPQFCAAVGCSLLYTRKDGALCGTFGCIIGVGVLTCLSICLEPEPIPM